MGDTLFIVFSVLTIACALAVVVNRNAVNAAMFLLVSLVGMAGLFVLLDAALLAFVLVLVYAGAVVALFLFIIMLLDTKGSTNPIKPASYVAGGLGAVLLALGVWSLIKRAELPGTLGSAVSPTFKYYAEQLFTIYLLPVQVVGFLLLIAMLGVIVLSKKFEVVDDPVRTTADRNPETGRT
jgi:NADH-quinone oxidoreductase subunit J